jgi:hypothetical protein
MTLGPRPPWWRPLARLAWARRARALLVEAVIARTRMWSRIWAQVEREREQRDAGRWN